MRGSCQQGVDQVDVALVDRFVITNGLQMIVGGAVTDSSADGLEQMRHRLTRLAGAPVRELYCL
jgi:hypothetical protein